jgi:ATP-binding cassette subfamily C protein
MLPALLSASGEQASLPPAFNAVVQAVLAATGLPNSLGGLTLTVVTMMVLRSLLLGAALTYAGFAIANVSTRMREDLLQAMFTTRWRYFVQHRAGAVANTISVDATRAGQAYLESARFIAGIIQATGYFIIGLMASVKFAFAGVIIGVVLIASLGKLIAVSRGAGAQQVDSTRDLVTLVADALNNIKPIKSMARTAPFIAMFGHNLVRLNESIKTQVLAAQFLERGTDILIALLVGISFYVGVSVFDISLAALAVTAAIGFQAFTVVRRMQGYLQRASELEAAYSSVENIYRELEREKERLSGATDISLARAIRFKNVSFAHGDEPTVRNVDLEIPAGRITVLQGPSGAGKTTLVDLLLGLHEPGSGEITIDGRPLAELSLNAWRSMVGYVPQELQLLHASLRDNIALGEQLGDEQLLRALDLAHARSFIESLPEGLDTNAGEMGGRLSGGQRQRIALARALVGAPKLLILDEVTSALDPKTEASICETAQQLAGDYTIIAITHRPAWSRIADRLYRIEAGQASEITGEKSGRRSRKAAGK